MVVVKAGEKVPQPPKAGDAHYMESIVLRIVEVLPFTDAMGMRGLQVAYKIIDGDRESPVAHWWQSPTEDPRKYAEEVLKNYLAMKRAMAL